MFSVGELLPPRTTASATTTTTTAATGAPHGARIPALGVSVRRTLVVDGHERLHPAVQPCRRRRVEGAQQLGHVSLLLVDLCGSFGHGVPLPGKTPAARVSSLRIAGVCGWAATGASAEAGESGAGSNSCATCLRARNSLVVIVASRARR